MRDDIDMRGRHRRLVVAVAALLLAGCRDPGKPLAEAALDAAPEATPLPEGMGPVLRAAFTGDLDGMVERRLIRVLTVQDPILYFIDRGREVGLTYETVRAFEKALNEKLGNKVVTVQVVTIPVSRDQVIPGLVSGKGDIAAGMVIVTPERKERVDFSSPFSTGVREVLVTGGDAPAVSSVDELSSQEVFVRPSSSAAEHLRKLNERLEREGKPPVIVVPAAETLEDGDILEMVAAGLVPATVVEDVVAELYVQAFPTLRRNADIASPPVDIAWAFRKGSPKLAEAVNAFVRSHKQGSLAGNVLVNKYLKTTKWVKNAHAEADRQRFESMLGLFKKYGDRYSLDHLLMAAQGYQESGLDQSKRSPVGAIGVMQVMPATARDKAIGIPDIENLESNIHAGIKYVRWMQDNFYDEPAISPLDKALFVFASYNAGPGRVAGLRKQAAVEGLDADKWFNNVELVAAKRIGRETVTYVSNIHKYYLAYQMMQARAQLRESAKAGVKKKS
jgi:membrane-bound lytic murein transglycosylase MltF